MENRNQNIDIEKLSTSLSGLEELDLVMKSLGKKIFNFQIGVEYVMLDSKLLSDLNSIYSVVKNASMDCKKKLLAYQEGRKEALHSIVDKENKGEYTGFAMDESVQLIDLKDSFTEARNELMRSFKLLERAYSVTKTSAKLSKTIYQLTNKDDELIKR